MSQLTAAQIAASLTRPQRTAVASANYGAGWQAICGPTRTLDALVRRGLAEWRAKSGFLRACYLTTEGQKAFFLMPTLSGFLTRAHTEALTENAPRTIEGTTPDGSTLTLTRPFLGEWLPVPVGGYVTDCTDGVFVVTDAVWRNDIDDRLCIVGHWLGDVVEGRTTENYALCSQGFNVRWEPKS